jgi:hypothetical protein
VQPTLLLEYRMQHNQIPAKRQEKEKEKEKNKLTKRYV